MIAEVVLQRVIPDGNFQNADELIRALDQITKSEQDGKTMD